MFGAIIRGAKLLNGSQVSPSIEQALTIQKQIAQTLKRLKSEDVSTTADEGVRIRPLLKRLQADAVTIPTVLVEPITKAFEEILKASKRGKRAKEAISPAKPQ
ncbi:MAG: hypothetical protein IPK79_03005 [Vampirovibrionales bacterium]|nr:hypothetical protein [Vampirovibrionales bacterium]